MNRTVFYVAAFAVGITARHIVREVQHQKEIQAMLDQIKVEGTRTFLEAHSAGYIAGERAAVLDYAPGKMEELIAAQEKRP